MRFAGFGGQGVVLCGFVFGQAAMLDGKSSMQTQSYGSASRGGLTHSDVCIQEGEIHDLIYDEFDVLVTLSQQSYDRYRPLLSEGGVLFYESDLVIPGEGVPERSHGLAATDLAYKEYGRKIMANMVMMGFVNAVTKAVSRTSLVASIRENVPAGTEDANEAAHDEGERRAGEAVDR